MSEEKKLTQEDIEGLKKDLSQIYGLFIIKHETQNKFYLLGVMKDDEVVGLNPCPEILRLYSRTKDSTVDEWVDCCTVKSDREIDGWLRKVNTKSAAHVRVVFTTDGCETIQHFDAPKLLRLKGSASLGMFDMLDDFVPPEDDNNPSTQDKE